MELTDGGRKRLPMNASPDGELRNHRVEMNRVLPLLILLVLPSLLEGHGRNSTSIRADVRKDEVRIAINAVVVDLLELTGTTLADWESLSTDERGQILRHGSELLVGRIRVVADGELLPPAGSFEINLPDVESGPDRWLPANQQSVSIGVKHSLSSAPENLIFWANFVTGSKGGGFPAQIIIRQEGELLMLPAGIGIGLPLAVSLDWISRPVPVAEQTGLSSSVAGWRNRPVNAILTLGHEEMSWRVFIPARFLLEKLSLSREPDIETIKDFMASHFSLSIDGEPMERGSISLRTYSMSAHDIAHGASENPGDLHDGMVELRICSTLKEIPNEIQLVNSLLGQGIEVLYTSVVREGDSPQYFLQVPDAPVLTCNATP
ncbi:MAG: hypothetical protein AB3N64_06825 [Puniceicoccaceae bacterium]